MAKDISWMRYNLYFKDENSKRLVPLDANGKKTKKATYPFTLRGAIKNLIDIREKREWEHLANHYEDELPTLIYQVRNKFNEILWEETMY